MIKKILAKKRLVVTGILIILFYVILIIGFRQFNITQEEVSKFVNQFGVFAFFALYLLQFLTSLSPLPDAILLMIAMVMFGPIWGAVIIFSGMYSAGIIHFKLARKLGKTLILKKFPEIKGIAEKVTAENMISKLVYLRIFMVLSFDAVSYIAGIAGASFKQYTISFIIGLLPTFISMGFITQGLLADGSPLSLIPGITIIVITAIITNLPKRGKIVDTNIK